MISLLGGKEALDRLSFLTLAVPVVAQAPLLPLEDGRWSHEVGPLAPFRPEAVTAERSEIVSKSTSPNFRNPQPTLVFLQ